MPERDTIQMPPTLLSRIMTHIEPYRVIVRFILYSWAVAVLLGAFWPLKTVVNQNQGNELSPVELSSAGAQTDSIQQLRHWGEDGRILEGRGQEQARKRTEISYVGLIKTSAGADFLLLMPDGEVQRFAEGDQLPDGRNISLGVSGEILLVSKNGDTQRLGLFSEIPRINVQPVNQDINEG